MTASYGHKNIAKASQHIILENQRNVLVFKHHKLVGRALMTTKLQKEIVPP